MNNKVNRLIFVVSLVLSTLTFLLAYNWLESQKQQAPVVVARRDIRGQQILTRADVDVVYIHKDAVHPSAFRSLNELFGPNNNETVVAKGPIYVGEQLLRPHVEIGSQAKSLAFKLREESDGYIQARAFSIRGTQENTFGGKLQEGDRVDIIAVFNRGSVVQEALSKRVFLNVKVLDINYIQLDNNRRQIDLITLLFERPEDVELFAMIQQFANSIHLALIPIGGPSSITRGYDSSGLMDALGLEWIPLTPGLY